MPTEVEVFRFLTPALKGRLTLTRYKMTRETAATRFPGCEPDLATREVRVVYGDGEAPTNTKPAG